MMEPLCLTRDYNQMLLYLSKVCLVVDLLFFSGTGNIHSSPSFSSSSSSLSIIGLDLVDKVIQVTTYGHTYTKCLKNYILWRAKFFAVPDQ